jgi:hypothetical protein
LRSAFKNPYDEPVFFFFNGYNPVSGIDGDGLHIMHHITVTDQDPDLTTGAGFIQNPGKLEQADGPLDPGKVKFGVFSHADHLLQSPSKLQALPSHSNTAVKPANTSQPMAPQRLCRFGKKIEIY